MNHELPDVQVGFRKGREPEIKLPTSAGSLKNQKSSRKTSISALLCRSQSTVENSERERNTRPPDLPLEKSVYRTGHGTTDWFQIGKGVHQGCILSPCLFNFYAEYTMRNTELEEAQAGIKIAGRNINNLRYADDTILMIESEEELKSLLMKVKEESEKFGLKLNI